MHGCTERLSDVLKRSSDYRPKNTGNETKMIKEGIVITKKCVENEVFISDSFYSQLIKHIIGYDKWPSIYVINPNFDYLSQIFSFLNCNNIYFLVKEYFDTKLQFLD